MRCVLAREAPRNVSILPMDECRRIKWDLVSCTNRSKLAFRQALMMELAFRQALNDGVGVGVVEVGARAYS